MSDTPFEPFVIVDRSEAPAVPRRRWTALRGRKPALLLVDRDGTGLDHPLASEGFDVYRTTGRESALELLRAHPSMLMALVRADLSDLDAPTLIRDLREARPGLWVGLLCDAGDRASAAAGYAAGAVDLFHRGADPREIVSRLIRGVPGALRRREQADRRGDRETRPWFRRLARRISSRMGLVATVLLGLGLGTGLAAVTRAWHESRDAWNARLDRFMSAMEASRPAVAPADRQFDRWHRFEQLNVQLQTQQSQQNQFRDRMEQERLQDLFRRLPSPQYPK